MARGLYVVDQLPPIDVAARPAVTTFTAAQDIYGAPQKILPKARMDQGCTLELYAHGEFSVTSATSPTFSAGFGIGAAALTATGLTILGQTQLVATGVASIVSGHYQLWWYGWLRTIGTGATGGIFKGRGSGRFANSLTPFNADVMYPMPVTQALAQSTFDCTADRPLNVLWQWGTSASTNTVTVDGFMAKVCS